MLESVEPLRESIEALHERQLLEERVRLWDDYHREKHNVGEIGWIIRQLAEIRVQLKGR